MLSNIFTFHSKLNIFMLSVWCYTTLLKDSWLIVQVISQRDEQAALFFYVYQWPHEPIQLRVNRVTCLRPTEHFFFVKLKRCNLKFKEVSCQFSPKRPKRGSISMPACRMGDLLCCGYVGSYHNCLRCGNETGYSGEVYQLSLIQAEVEVVWRTYSWGC